MTRTEIAAMADALSWARTLLDDPGAAKSKGETIELIDDALRPYGDGAERPPMTRDYLKCLLRATLDAAECGDDEMLDRCLIELTDNL